MRSFSRLALLAGAASVALASDVHDLNKDTFNPFIKDHGLVLAEFFAPWCGHCKALAPEYETAATSLKEKNIPLAKIDCTVETELCKTHEVEGYPTLKVFRGNPEESTSYGGQRKSDAIISYMTKQSLPPVSIMESTEKFNEFKGSDNIVLVAFLAADDKASNETITDFAASHRDDYLVGASHDAELAKAEGVKVPGLVLYKTFDEGKVVFDGKFEKAAILEFAKVAGVPLVGEVGPDTYSSYMSSGIPLAYIFAATKEEREKLGEELKPIAKKHKGKINFATIDSETFGQHAANLNLEVGKWPAFAIQKTDKNEKYPFDQTKEITAKSIGPFVADFVAGKASPSVKSEPIPETQEGPVTVVVAHSYKDLVINNDKDVLLEFYAPWCGHCKALAPKYEELGAIYANNPEFAKLVTIAKIDATANDVPEEVQGFPTIKLFPAKDKKTPVEYNGSRTVEDFIKFIKESGSHKVAAPVPEAKDESSSAADPESTEKAKEDSHDEL